MTTDFDSVDYFTDPSLVPDPHPYYDHLRSKCPVVREPHHGVIAVTGWDEANAVYKDTGSFSSCVAIMGPFTPLPFVPDGDDISAQIEAGLLRFKTRKDHRRFAVRTERTLACSFAVEKRGDRTI